MPDKPEEPDSRPDTDRNPTARETGGDGPARPPGSEDDASGCITTSAADELALVLGTLAPAAGATAVRVTVRGGIVAEWLGDDGGRDDADAEASADDVAGVGQGNRPVGAKLRKALPARHIADAVLELDLPPDTAPTRAGATALEALVVAVSRILDCDAMEVALGAGATQREHFLVALQHELRTPATALMLEAGLLQSGLLGNLPPRVRSTLERLERQVGDFIRVVQRVLDLAEVDNLADGRADLVDVRGAIVAVARNAEPEASRRGVLLSLFFPRTIPAVQTDEDRFRRVVNHLLANAVKYSGAGRVQIRVEREAGSEGVSELLVRIADSGPGIPAEELERVFEPFAQVEEGARTDSRHRGLGLGLSIARRLARSIGGDVTVESEAGIGTTATFSLPLRRPVSG